MSLVGYARVSSFTQCAAMQEEQLVAAGCQKIFSEKRSGTSVDGRCELAAALEWVREGDVLCVTRLDRLARSMTDLRKIVDDLTARGVGFRVLQQGSIDTTRADGKLLLNVLASFAEFETDIRKERQAEGIARAKAEKRFKGRPARIAPSDIARLRAEGMGPSAIARTLGIARASVYRLSAQP
jgi:DNA invertase Pin-like site-specific DNA recombinase